MDFPVLTLLGLLPIVGGVLLFLPLRSLARPLGFLVALATLGVAIWATVLYVDGTDLSQTVTWIAPLGAYWALDLDGMGLSMIVMTAVLTPVVLLAGWNTGNSDRPRWTPQVFFALVLILEGMSVFVFAANDLLLFYLFFEATLIPMYFLIGGFGGPKRAAAALKFLLYSLFGGLIMLAGVVGVWVVSGDSGNPTFLMTTLTGLIFDGAVGQWLFVGFMVGFAVKAPMVPLHTWLPDTAQQATPGTSILLVGVLDKIGTFGMIRFCLGLFPEAAVWATPVMVVLALISIIYGALAAIGSKDILRLIAYTSISHFGFMVLGIFVFTTQSLTGSMFYMVNHGFSTAALFLAAGFLISRRGSQKVADFGGVQKVTPVLAGVFLVSGLSGLALPGMASFVSEFLVLAGTWSRNPWIAAVAALGMVLSAVYILSLYQKTMTGPPTTTTSTHFKRDLSPIERLVMVPVLGVLLFFGFFPQPIVHLVEPVATVSMQDADEVDPAPQAEGVK